MSYLSLTLLVVVAHVANDVTVTVGAGIGYTTRTSHWTAKKNAQGQNLCSVDTPSQITTAKSRINCQMTCSSTGQGCWNFNFFSQRKSCEMFFFLPTNFASGVAQCQHFEVMVKQKLDVKLS
jgi:hypothetical protein